MKLELTMEQVYSLSGCLALNEAYSEMREGQFREMAARTSDEEIRAMALHLADGCRDDYIETRALRDALCLARWKAERSNI